MYIVELEKGVWLDDCEGDPSRTMMKDSAASFPSRRKAEIALADARKYRPFEKADIIYCEI